jgi:hypothetical protein
MTSGSHPIYSIHIHNGEAGRSRGLIPGRGKVSSPHHSVMIGSETYLGSYLVVIKA